MKWQYGGKWSMSLLSWTAFAKMYLDGRDSRTVYLEFKNNSSYFYRTVRDYCDMMKTFDFRIKQDPDFLKKRLKQIPLDWKQNYKKLKEINLDLKKGKNLEKLFADYWEYFRKIIFGQAIDLYFDEILCPKLKSILQERLRRRGRDNQLDAYYILLVTPDNLTTTQRADLDFLQLMAKPGQKREKSFSQYLKKYAYLPMWFDGEATTLADLKKRAVAWRGRNIKKELRAARRAVAGRKNEFSQTVKFLDLDKEALALVKIIREFTFLRHEGEVIISYHNFAGQKLKRAVAERLKLPFYNLGFLTDEEIINGLRKNINWRSAVRERKKHCFMIMDRGQYKILIGKRAKKEAARLSRGSEVGKADGKLTGFPVSRGVTRGSARVLRGLADIKKFRAGEIMVVSGTSLEYLPAMQISAGIITEMGGLTSHAAVIARELGKPCLTQVPDATRRLKNGEQVELDANTGLIKKL